MTEEGRGTAPASRDVVRTSNLGLPPLINLSDFETLDNWLDYLHWQYLAIVQDAGLHVLGKRIERRGAVCADGRDARFWHLVTDGDGGGGPRRLAPGRAARLGQAWHVLELLAAGDIRAVWWREGYRVYVSTVDFRLLIVLQESPQHFRLITMYPTSRRRRGRYFSRAAAAWESGACDRSGARPRSLSVPYRSTPAWERARCWM